MVLQMDTAANIIAYMVKLMRRCVSSATFSTMYILAIHSIVDIIDIIKQIVDNAISINPQKFYCRWVHVPS